MKSHISLITSLHSSCSPNWSATSALGISYNCFLLVVGFLLPTLLIVGSNCLVMKSLQNVSKQFKILCFAMVRQ